MLSQRRLKLSCAQAIMGFHMFLLRWEVRPFFTINWALKLVPKLAGWDTRKLSTTKSSKTKSEDKGTMEL